MTFLQGKRDCLNDGYNFHQWLVISMGLEDDPEVIMAIVSEQGRKGVRSCILV
jgi:hypothetical protein